MKKKKLTKVATFALAAVLAFAMLALTACGGSSSDGGSTPADDSAAPAGSSAAAAPAAQTGDAVLKIGFIGPLTGAAALYGNAAKQGAEIAVEEINADEAIPFSIEFKAEDDVHDAETSVNAYNNLMDWGMQVLVGTVTTTPCVAVSAETNKDRVFEITPSASSTAVIEGKDNVFQICFTDPNQGVASADYLAENQAGEKIAVIYKNDDAYSQGIRDTFVKEAAEKNLEVVYEGTFTEDTQTDFSVQLTAAQAAGATVVFLPMYYTPASVIFKQAKDMGYSPLFFGVDGMDGILDMDGFDTSLAEGVMLLTPFSADSEENGAPEFVAKYQEKYGEVPSQFAADGYDAVRAVAEVFMKAGLSTDQATEEICDGMINQITQSSFNGLTGAGMTWESTGEVSKAPMAVVIKDGTYVTP